MTWTPDGKLQDLKKLIRSFVAELDTSTMPYVNEGLRAQLALKQMSDIDRAGGRAGISVGSALGGQYSEIERFEAGRSSELRWAATDLKRKGQCLASAQKTIESFRLDEHYDLGNLRNLWKTAFVGGDAAGAVALIRKAIDTYAKYPLARQYEQLPCPPNDDLDDVLEAMQTEQSCRERLKAFSGNPDYWLPTTFESMKSELHDDRSRQFQSSSQSATSKSSGGCYIATAVYGSYEAPEVIVLRKFRDERLQPTFLGRAFISLYYAVSPSLARHIPNHQRLSNQIRHGLDSLVKRLQSRR